MKKAVTKFYFQKAKYLVGDDFGNQVYMQIDYKNAKYKILTIKATKIFKAKVVTVAKGLISKKHNVNFSDRIEV